MTRRYNSFLGGVLLAGIFFSVVPTITRGQGGLPPVIGGQWRPMTQLRGNIVCVRCTVEEAKKTRPDAAHLYTLQFDGGQLVMNVEWVNQQSRQYLEDVAGLTNTIQIRASHNLLQELTTEEHLFKEMQITGLLRTTRTFDIASIEVRE